MANVRDHYADSSIRSVTNHVGRLVLHRKIREQLQDKLSETDERRESTGWGLDGWTSFPEETLSHDRSPELYNAALDL